MVIYEIYPYPDSIFFNGQWFSLNKNGEHCEMISAAVCLTPILLASSVYAYDDLETSRCVVLLFILIRLNNEYILKYSLLHLPADFR